MSKTIVKTLRPDSRVVFHDGYYVIEDRGQQIGQGANTPQDAWHEASVYLRGENYEQWFEAARKPTYRECAKRVRLNPKGTKA